MNKVDKLFKNLWTKYSSENMQVREIHRLLERRGETVKNDHVAFRTFNLPGINVDCIGKVFKELGYEEKGEYVFEKKKLTARHFELEGRPRVFISQLELDQCSEELQEIVKRITYSIPADFVFNAEHLYCGSELWREVTFENYNKLLVESEYAAWTSVFGYGVNHFTVSVNELTTFNNIKELNGFLKENRFLLNTSGGEIKGGEDVSLAQSSTLADLALVKFDDQPSATGIPCCFYEFAERFNIPGTDKLYDGFVAASADKIFESTNAL
jgi:hypothetical protein